MSKAGRPKCLIELNINNIEVHNRYNQSEDVLANKRV